MSCEFEPGSEEGDGYDVLLRTAIRSVDAFKLQVVFVILVLHSIDDVRAVQQHVLDAAGEIASGHHALLHVRHATDVQVTVKVELSVITYTKQTLVN